MYSPDLYFSTNFVRHNIYQVFESCSALAMLVTNRDEFVRRIFGVMYSNDAIARAVTLRFVASSALFVVTDFFVCRSLGVLAPLTAKRSTVQHAYE